jgi:hypothetical protein
MSDLVFVKSDKDKVRWRFLPLSVIRDVAFCTRLRG